jgi:hypothetical protein
VKVSSSGTMLTNGVSFITLGESTRCLKGQDRRESAAECREPAFHGGDAINMTGLKNGSAESLR